MTGDNFVERYLAWLDRHYLLTGMNQESLTSAGFFKNYLFFYALPRLLSEKMQKLDQGLLRQVQSWGFFTALSSGTWTLSWMAAPGSTSLINKGRSWPFLGNQMRSCGKFFLPGMPSGKITRRSIGQKDK